MISIVTNVFVSNLLPVMVVIVLGAVVHRIRPIDLPSLVTLNFFLFVPAYLFSRVSSSKIAWYQIGQIGLVTTGPILVTGLLLFILLKWMKVRRETMAATIVGGLFFNAANFGVPLMEQTFGTVGGQTQALVVMFMNLTVFCAGYGILAVGQGHTLWGALKMYLRLPLAYVIVAALVVREFSISIPTWAETSIDWIGDGMVPVALITLGAQLADKAAWPNWRIIGPVVLIKLVLMPCITAIFVVVLGTWPWPGKLLVLASAAPTAVNTLLLSLELKGDSKTAADIVVWTTIVSCLTVALALTVLQAILGADWRATHAY